jgi:hypothetical protein
MKSGPQFGEELVVGGTGRCGQTPSPRECLRESPSPWRTRSAVAASLLRHIEIGFIKRERFDEGGVMGEKDLDLARDGAIDLETRRHDTGAEHRCTAVIEGLAERAPNARLA